MEVPVERVVGARDLPSPPVLLARVIRLATDPNVGGPKLATVIAGDPMFAAEVIRAANNVTSAGQTQVTTVHRAVIVLGGRNLRSLAICSAARDVMRQCGLGAEDAAGFWEDALRRGVAARRLARRTGLADPEEAFATGLLAEFGMIALLRSARWYIPEWPALRRELPLLRLAREAELFGATHTQVAAEVLGKWGLPSALVMAVAHHHNDFTDAVLPREQVGLAQVLCLADRVAAVFTANSPVQARGDAAKAASAGHGIGADEIDALLEAMPRGVEEAAMALGLRVRPQPTRQEALASPGREVTDVHLSYEELAVRLDMVSRERELLADQVARLREQLEELVWYDALTGLSTRRRFEDCVRRELARARVEGSPLSLVVLALDAWRQVVDEHGEVLAESVVRLAGQVMLGGTRAADLKGRLDDDTFAVLLTGAKDEPARALAERLRMQISMISVRNGLRAVHPTASFGGVTVLALPAGADEDAWLRLLLERVEHALAAARHAGGNRVVWAE